jgi:hypothetical protein
VDKAVWLRTDRMAAAGLSTAWVQYSESAARSA